MRIKYPFEESHFADFRATLREHVLPGYLPAHPPLSRTDRVVTQGSCFAGNIHDALVQAGINSTHSGLMEIVNTPRAIRAFIEFVFGQREELAGINPDAPKLFRAAIDNAAAFIFTVGLIYEPTRDKKILFDISGGKVIWRKSTLNENAEHLRAIIATLKAAKPGIKIVLTLSPIPIGSFYGGSSAVVADCISKSSLRTAIDWVMDDRISNVYYWPSFEAVRWLSGHMGQMFGTEGETQRHLGSSTVRMIVDEFIHSYFAP